MKTSHDISFQDTFWIFQLCAIYAAELLAGNEPTRRAGEVLTLLIRASISEQPSARPLAFTQTGRLRVHTADG
jgi:hypothetical protein